MYILEGEGVYLLDEDWRLIKKGDFVWFGPYCPQAAYAPAIPTSIPRTATGTLPSDPVPAACPKQKTSGELISPEVFDLC